MHEEHRQSSRAVVQIYIDDGHIPNFDRSRQSDKIVADSTSQFKDYASRYGADYFFFQDRYFDNVHPQNEIFRVLTMDYDQIFTVDVDVVINRDENIFNEANEWMTAAYRPGMDTKINSGVLVWGREARKHVAEVWSIDRAESLKNRDQDHLQEIFGTGFNYISDAWNDYLLRDEGIFHHYKGGMKRNYK